MNKQELIKSMATKMESTLKDAELALNAFTSSVEESLAKKEKVVLVGFGTFEVREKAGRTGTIQFGENKGKEWKSEASFSPAFKAGKNLKEIVNQ